MQIDVILGLQWGDEGKGKVVDYFAPRYDVVCRFQGGPNAGHTIYIDGEKHVLHTIPSGIFHEETVNVIGSGLVLDPITFAEEWKEISNCGVNLQERLLVARKAHLILPTHRYLDAASEAAKGKEKIGSTLRGIGPTYMDKTGRNGLRVGDLFEDDFMQRYEKLKNKHLGLLKQYPEVDFDLQQEEDQWLDSISFLRSSPTIDCPYYLRETMRSGKRILAEGAQGSMLDIEFGTYPYVTSSNTIAAGVCTGLGIPPNAIGEVIGITKSYCTRVGGGPFPTEDKGEQGEALQTAGKEFGATTGRARRCGWIDLPQLEYACLLNGVTELCVTKMDVLNGFDPVKIGTAYEMNGHKTTHLPYDLDAPGLKPVFEDCKGWTNLTNEQSSFDQIPEEARNYIRTIEERLDISVSYLSIGPEREDFIVR